MQPEHLSLTEWARNNMKSIMKHRKKYEQI